jgi:nitroreductase
MLEAARRAPDHKELTPWRFFPLRGDKKESFGLVLESALRERDPEASDGQLQKERHKLDRAPLVLVVGTERVPTHIPFEELIAATSAAIQNILLIATDMGFGSMWRTGDAAYDKNVKTALGLGSDDFINGFIYLGTTAETPR